MYKLPPKFALSWMIGSKLITNQLPLVISSFGCDSILDLIFKPLLEKILKTKIGWQQVIHMHLSLHAGRALIANTCFKFVLYLCVLCVNCHRHPTWNHSSLNDCSHYKRHYLILHKGLEFQIGSLLSLRNLLVWEINVLFPLWGVWISIMGCVNFKWNNILSHSKQFQIVTSVITLLFLQSLWWLYKVISLIEAGY